MAPSTATAERPATPTQKPATSQAAVQPGQAMHPIVAFKGYMDQRMGEVALALPPQISPDRFARVVLTALQRKPDLLKCTKQSLFNACMLAAQDGLLPDGREGAIAPYGESDGGKRVAEIATWMPMIEGLRKKARNSGEISNWEAHIVRQKDHFEVILGDAPRIDHKPYIGSEDPGPVVAAYSVAWLKDGTISREVMTVRDLNKIKAKSKAAKGPWSDPAFEPEMYRKTVARRHYKSLPHSSDLDEMIRRDDEAFGLEDRDDAQIADRQTRRLASTAAAFDEFGKAPVIEHEAGELSEPAEAQDGIDGKFDDDAAVARGEDAQERHDQQPAPEAKTPPPGQQQPVEQPRQEPAPAKGATWPKDQVPKTAEEYQQYAEAYIAGETNGDAIAPWFKSEGERKLRNSCNVTKDTFDAVKLTAANRISAIKSKA